MEQNQPIKKRFPGEGVLLTEIRITQGLLFILLMALVVFITESLYLKYAEYILIIWYITIWLLKIVRDGADEINL